MEIVLALSCAAVVVFSVVAFKRRHRQSPQIVRASKPGRYTAFGSALSRRCELCGERFRPGDLLSAINPSPAGDEDKARAKEGRPHNATASLAHEICVRDAIYTISCAAL